MRAKLHPAQPAEARPGEHSPSIRRLGLKLLLGAGLAAALAVGTERALPTLCLLLQALFGLLAALSCAVALIHRESPWQGGYGHWHEAAAFAVAALGSYLALLTLR